MPEPRRVPPAAEKLAPKAVVGRVSLYLRQLELFDAQGHTTVSSSQLGSALGINDAQVRKDLAFFGQFGYPGIGYRIAELSTALRAILGIDREWPTALVGWGNLGRALLKYHGFQERGFQIVAIFDNDPAKIGQSRGGLTVQPIEQLSQAAEALKIGLAILCVPSEAAQRVADHVVASGIRGIMNFAPFPLHVPDSVGVVGVDLSVQLEHLAYKVRNSEGRDVA